MKKHNFKISNKMRQLDTNILHLLEEYSKKGTADSLVVTGPTEKTKDYSKKVCSLQKYWKSVIEQPRKIKS